MYINLITEYTFIFKYLTLRSSYIVVIIFVQLKGYISDLVPSEIERIMVSLGLLEKKDARSETLSGGWKRKLSVGVALVGGSRV